MTYPRPKTSLFNLVVCFLKQQYCKCKNAVTSYYAICRRQQEKDNLSTPKVKVEVKF